MRENSENEEKLTKLIQKNKNVLKKLLSFKKIEELKNYLESNDIRFSDGELRKLLLVFNYFGNNDENSSLQDDDLGMSGGKIEIGKGLFSCLNLNMDTDGNTTFKN